MQKRISIVAINTLQVAWLSRLAAKGIISRGQSIVEFSPQDVFSPRHAVRHYALRHNRPDEVERLLDGVFDGETARRDGIPAFYRLFGVDRYRSLDLLDARADLIRDFNQPVTLDEQFDLATNFGTAEHVFNVGQLFHSIHDAIRPGGVALHVLPAFGDIDHGFYNIHPTIYFDLAKANNYTIEDFCYVDRWDIRNKMLEADLADDVDFDAFPVRIREMKDRAVLQRKVTEQFIANYSDSETQRHGASYPGVLYDYCIAALRKTHSQAFRFPMQGYYASHFPATLSGFKSLLAANIRDRGIGWIPGAVLRRIRLYWRTMTT